MGGSDGSGATGPNQWLQPTAFGAGMCGVYFLSCVLDSVAHLARVGGG